LQQHCPFPRLLCSLSSFLEATIGWEALLVFPSSNDERFISDVHPTCLFLSLSIMLREIKHPNPQRMVFVYKIYLLNSTFLQQLLGVLVSTMSYARSAFVCPCKPCDFTNRCAVC
jgi:hypothetical protein